MKEQLQITHIAEEGKILRGCLCKIFEAVGLGVIVLDDCHVDMLEFHVKEVISRISAKNETITTNDSQLVVLRSLNRTLSDRVAELESDLAECRINLREADAKPAVTIDKDSIMLGRIGHMIPVEFYRTTESTVEQAVALLLDRYYSEMATNMYNQNQKLENQ